MKYAPGLSYPPDEGPKIQLLEDLFCEWHEHFASNGSVLEPGHSAEDMAFDGFYPHYFSQKKRILFIGWEPLGVSGNNSIDVIHEAYHETKTISGRPLNNDNFHSRMLRIAYGIMNGMPKWEEIPSANEIGDTVGVEQGLSFASMNISKLSNDSGSSNANWPAIESAYELSIHGPKGRIFIRDEVAILKPEIIITMNLIAHLEDGLNSLGSGEFLYQDPAKKATSYLQNIDAHRCLLIDTYHFSARGMDDELGFYSPICDAIRHAETSPNP
jgi:hypothetical protein